MSGDWKQQAMEKCPACKEGVSLKTQGGDVGRMVHLDLFATAEHGAIYDCQALDILRPHIVRVDERDNPEWDDGEDFPPWDDEEGD